MPEMETTVSLYSLKGEARQMVERSRSTDAPITHAQALEKVARGRGFANWNACSAHYESDAKPIEPTKRVEAAGPRELKDFEPLDDPAFWFSADQVGGALSRSIGDLSAWARRLELLADSTDPAAYGQMISLMGERKPYMFERNPARWPDGKFHLVDRGYVEFKHVAFTQEELVQHGFGRWAESKYCWSGVDDGYFVMDDQFGRNADPVGLKWLARLLMAMANKVFDEQEERAPEGMSKA